MQPPEIASSVNFNSMRSAIFRRSKNRKLPNIPKYLLDFDDVLKNNFEPTKKLFRGIVEAKDGSAAAVFASDLMISLLNSNDTKKVDIDATFSVSPRQMSIYQLYTVHIQSHGSNFCSLWVLMTRKTLHLYSAIWEKILKLAPKLRQNLTEIMSDFETAMHKSISNSIPREITVKACWFHFCQALLRYWKKVGLIRRKAPKTLLWMVMNLALAPDTQFSEGLELIEKVCKDDIQKFKEIGTFLDYVKKQWIPLASVLCVCNCSQRTNNAVESFHKHAFEELGGNHPNMYAFLTKMAAYIDAEDLQYLRVLKGYSIRRRDSKASVANNAHILHCQNQLIIGKMGLEEFLKTVVTRQHQNQMDDLLEITELSSTLDKSVEPTTAKRKNNNDKQEERISKAKRGRPSKPKETKTQNENITRRKTRQSIK